MYLQQHVCYSYIMQITSPPPGYVHELDRIYRIDQESALKYTENKAGICDLSGLCRRTNLGRQGVHATYASSLISLVLEHLGAHHRHRCQCCNEGVCARSLLQRHAPLRVISYSEGD